MCADWVNKWVPHPFQPQLPVQPLGPVWPPQLPIQPQLPAPPLGPVWPKEMLDQLEDILARIKKLEDAVGGCPCEEPEKLDYLKEIRKMIEGGNPMGL